MLSLRASSTQTFSFSIHFILASFSGVLFSLASLFLKLAFLCYSSTALAGGYSCVTLTLTLSVSALSRNMSKNKMSTVVSTEKMK